VSIVWDSSVFPSRNRISPGPRTMPPAWELDFLFHRIELCFVPNQSFRSIRISIELIPGVRKKRGNTSGLRPAIQLLGQMKVRKFWTFYAASLKTKNSVGSEASRVSRSPWFSTASPSAFFKRSELTVRLPEIICIQQFGKLGFRSSGI
jgi:hypothetical protein